MNFILYFITSILCVVVAKPEMKPIEKNIKKINQQNSRLDNEVYGTSNNGLTQRAPWPQPRQNVKMFRLPKALNANDEIVVKGEMIEDMQRLFLGLTRGNMQPDIENIVFYIEIDKQSDKFYIGSKQNGFNTSAGDVSESFSELANGSKLNFSVKINRNNEGHLAFKVAFFEYLFDQAVLINNLEDITYLIINGDVLKVNELQFLFGNEPY